MKRFWLFAGDHYYPSGGIQDFIGDFDDLEDARAKVRHHRENSTWGLDPDFTYDWYHIVDMDTRKKIEQDGEPRDTSIDEKSF